MNENVRLALDMLEQGVVPSREVLLTEVKTADALNYTGLLVDLENDELEGVDDEVLPLVDYLIKWHSDFLALSNDFVEAFTKAANEVGRLLDGPPPKVRIHQALADADLPIMGVFVPAVQAAILNDCPFVSHKQICLASIYRTEKVLEVSKTATKPIVISVDLPLLMDHAINPVFDTEGRDALKALTEGKAGYDNGITLLEDRPEIFEAILPGKAPGSTESPTYIRVMGSPNPALFGSIRSHFILNPLLDNKDQINLVGLKTLLELIQKYPEDAKDALWGGAWYHTDKVALIKDLFAMSMEQFEEAKGDLPYLANFICTKDGKWDSYDFFKLRNPDDTIIEWARICRKAVESYEGAQLTRCSLMEDYMCRVEPLELKVIYCKNHYD